MSTTAKAPAARVDQFFTVAEARFDRWRSLLQAARVWEAAANRQPSEKEKRSEEHTSELQSLTNLVCRLLLEKKKNEPEEVTRFAQEDKTPGHIPDHMRTTHADREPIA